MAHDALTSHSDGIDPHAFLFGNLGSGEGRDVAGVVGAVGDEDDHFGGGFARGEAAHSVGQAHTDGRALGNHARTLQVATDIAEHGEQGSVVGSHGTLREGFTTEEGEADVVVLTTGDELVGHLLGGLNAVRFEVLREHTHRDVHRNHDVDAFHLTLALRRGGLRTCQNHDHQHQHQQSQHEGQVHQSGARCERKTAQRLGRGHAQRWFVTTTPKDVGHNERNDEQ